MHVNSIIVILNNLTKLWRQFYVLACALHHLTYPEVGHGFGLFFVWVSSLSCGGRTFLTNHELSYVTQAPSQRYLSHVETFLVQYSVLKMLVNVVTRFNGLNCLLEYNIDCSDIRACIYPASNS